LPHAYLVNNYADSDTTWLANYSEDIYPTTGSVPGVRISGENLSVWRESFINLKSSPLGVYSAVLGWDDRFSKRPASYTMVIDRAAPKSDRNASLVFSASDAGISSLPEGFRLKGSVAQKTSDTRDPLDWTIVLTDENAAEAGSRCHMMTCSIHRSGARPCGSEHSQARRHPRLSCVAFNSPFNDFASANAHLDLAHLRSIRFDFDRGTRGAIVLSDVGLARMYE
jgi:hypothetical protein